MRKILKIITPFVFVFVLLVAQKTLAAEYSFEEFNCAAMTDPTKMVVCYIAGRAMSLILTVGSLLSIAFVIYGGFQLVTSTGDPAKVKTARNIIIGACIGLAIIILAATIRSFAVDRVLQGNYTTIKAKPGSNIPGELDGGTTTPGDEVVPEPPGDGSGDEVVPEPPPSDPPSPQTIPVVLNQGMTPKDLCLALRSKVHEQYRNAFLKAHVMTNNNEFEVFYKTKEGGSLFLDRWNNYPDSTKNNYLRINIQNLGQQDYHPTSTDCNAYSPPTPNPTGDFPGNGDLPAV